MNPQHIAIIPDGNRRQSRHQNLSSNNYTNGALNVINSIKWSLSKNISKLTIWALSTDNLKRHKDDVESILATLSWILTHKKDFFIRNSVRITFVGNKKPLTNRLINVMDDIEASTKQCSSLHVFIAINYNGMDDIIDAINAGSNYQHPVTRQIVSEHLQIPPIDLLIRTGGEKRLSNGMIWQLAYSELYFCDCFQPDFTETDFDDAIKQYESRQRRFGT